MGRPRIYGSDRDKQRAYRARLVAGAQFRLDAPTPPVAAVIDHGDPVGALAEWAQNTLSSRLVTLEAANLWRCQTSRSSG